MADIWILLIEELDGGIDVLPFSDEAEAIGTGRRRAGRDGVPREELPAWQRENGWAHVFPCGIDGRRYSVIRRSLNATISYADN